MATMAMVTAGLPGEPDAKQEVGRAAAGRMARIMPRKVCMGRTKKNREISPLAEGWPLVFASVDDALRKTGGNRRLAAEMLGVSERKLYRWIKAAKVAEKRIHRDMTAMACRAQRTARG
jgi:DNA-binding NtrC family response regulator